MMVQYLENPKIFFQLKHYFRKYKGVILFVIGIEANDCFL